MTMLLTPWMLPPGGRWVVSNSAGMRIGELHYTKSATHGEGWKFWPDDQGLPSRKLWKDPQKAIPRRFRRVALYCDPVVSKPANDRGNARPTAAQEHEDGRE